MRTRRASALTRPRKVQMHAIPTTPLDSLGHDDQNLAAAIVAPWFGSCGARCAYAAALPCFARPDDAIISLIPSRHKPHDRRYCTCECARFADSDEERLDVV